jgi:hypothetical protein
MARFPVPGARTGHMGYQNAQLFNALNDKNTSRLKK